MKCTTDEVGFVPDRMASPIGTREGIAPNIASNIVREFGSCPGCSGDLDPDVTDAVYSDRDVLWDDDYRNSEYHTCESCGSELRIFVEEKAFGMLSESQLPSGADEFETVYYVPCENSSTWLVINMNQISISEQ